MISVITPVYNSELYLYDFVSSVLQQSYTDYELILIDDNSSDDSLKICESFAKKDDRIKVYHLERNEGASRARNFGIKKSHGDYITFADSDDYLPKDALGKLLADAVDKKSDIVFGNIKVISPTNDFCIRKFPNGKRIFNKSEAISAYLNFWILYGATWGKLYTRECVDNISFPEDMKIGEDGVFCARAIARTKKISVIDDIVYEYKQRKNSTSNHGKFSKKELEDRILQKNYVELAFSPLMNTKDMDVFTFELYRVIKYWEKNFYDQLNQSKREYKILKEFCDKKWFSVFVHTYNIRIKVRTIKYKLGLV